MEHRQAIPPNQWYVLIEEDMTTRGFRQWSMTGIQPAGPDLEHARRLAADAALMYKPQNPKRPRGRQVFQTGADSWLVVVAGATERFHFRVSVGLLTAATTT
jgi:hypothetical protein